MSRRPEKEYPAAAAQGGLGEHVGTPRAQNWSGDHRSTKLRAVE